MYRPEGWVNPHISLVSMKPINEEYDAYEAGADAMLERLKGEATKHFNSIGHLKAGDKGWLVFIPEDQ